MNTNQLNQVELGNANSFYGVYLRGAVSVLATGVGAFTSLTYQSFTGTVSVISSGVGKFGAVLHAYGKTDSTSVVYGYPRAIQSAFGVMSAVAEGVGAFGVGLSHTVFGFSAQYLVSVWYARVNVALKGASDPTATVHGSSGLQYSVYGHGLPTAFTSGAAFTAFGEYAPAERYIIVPNELRTLTVV